MCQAKFIQGSLFSMVAGTGVEFGGCHCRQDGSLKYACVLSQPQVVFSPTKPDVNAGIEQKRTGWE